MVLTSTYVPEKASTSPAYTLKFVSESPQVLFKLLLLTWAK